MWNHPLENASLKALSRLTSENLRDSTRPRQAIRKPTRLVCRRTTLVELATPAWVVGVASGLCARFSIPIRALAHTVHTPAIVTSHVEYLQPLALWRTKCSTPCLTAHHVVGRHTRRTAMKCTTGFTRRTLPAFTLAFLIMVSAGFAAGAEQQKSILTKKQVRELLNLA